MRPSFKRTLTNNVDATILLHALNVPPLIQAYFLKKLLITIIFFGKLFFFSKFGMRNRSCVFVIPIFAFITIELIYDAPLTLWIEEGEALFISPIYSYLVL